MLEKKKAHFDAVKVYNWSQCNVSLKFNLNSSCSQLYKTLQFHAAHWRFESLFVTFTQLHMYGYIHKTNYHKQKRVIVIWNQPRRRCVCLSHHLMRLGEVTTTVMNIIQSPPWVGERSYKRISVEVVVETYTKRWRWMIHGVNPHP